MTVGPKTKKKISTDQISRSFTPAGEEGVLRASAEFSARDHPTARRLVLSPRLSVPVTRGQRKCFAARHTRNVSPHGLLAVFWLLFLCFYFNLKSNGQMMLLLMESHETEPSVRDQRRERRVSDGFLTILITIIMTIRLRLKSYRSATIVSRESRAKIRLRVV